MKKIKHYVDEICDELNSAKEYAEMYVEYKAKGDSQWASRFQSMANDELNHANIIHELAVKETEEISQVFKAPAEMQEVWDKSHADYVEKAAWIRQMLSM